MKRSTLRDSLRQMLRHPPSKLNPSLISEIYAKWTSPEDLDDFLASDIFQTVLWRFFHVDVTNTHLELLLQIASYEFEVLSSHTCINLVLKDIKRLDGLLHRLLQSTMARRKQDERLQTSIFVFLRTLVMVSPTTLTDHPLYQKWISSMLPSYIQAVSGNEINVSHDSILLRRSLLSFFLGCTVSSSDECRKLVVESWFPFYFLEDSSDFFSYRLAQLICFLAYPTTSKYFISFQQTVSDLGLKSFQFCEYASSPLDVSREEFSESLVELAIPEKIRLCEAMNCRISQEKAIPSVLQAVITHFALGSNISYSTLSEYTNFNENDIFDLFEHKGSLPFIPAPTVPVPKSFSPFWVDQINISNTYEYLKKINRRVIAVFERLTIVDPGSERGIKGSSKYFSQIQHLKVLGAKATFECNNVKLLQSLKPGDHVVLLEVSKPNRSGNGSREIKYGVNSCAITKVLSLRDSVYFDWNFDGFADRFNCLIVIPSPLPESNSYTRDNSLSESLGKLWGYEKEPIKISSSEFTNPEPECETETESKSENDRIKKRKLENGDSVSEKFSPTSSNDNVIQISSNNVSDVAGEFKRLFFNKSSIRSVSATGLKGFEKFNVIRAFLSTLDSEAPSESCLVIMPTKAAVDLFPLDEELPPFTFLNNSNTVHVSLEIKRLQRHLDDVSVLSEKLGLQEYDFSSSIRNALMLYHSHIQPKWKEFLKSVTKERYAEYPFAKIESNNFDEAMQEIVNHFSELRSLFSWLEERLLFDKFELHNLTSQNSLELQRFLSARCKYLIIAEENMHLIERSFDNVIAHDTSVIPRLKGGFQRLVTLGNSLKMPTQMLFSTVCCRESIASLVRESGIKVSPSFNPGFKHCLQHVKVSSSKEDLLVEEARLCVSIYQYMRLLGYPWQSISIGVKSEQMKSLIGEILHERGILRTDTPAGESMDVVFGYPILQNIQSLYPSDILIVACFGNPSLMEYQKIACSGRKGLYLIGSDKNFPFEIHSGRLELIPNETYLTENRSDENPVFISSGLKMCEYVDDMIGQQKSRV